MPIDEYPNVREIRLDFDRRQMGTQRLKLPYTWERLPHSEWCINPICNEGGLVVAEKVREKIADMASKGETQGHIEIICHGWETMGKLPKALQWMERDDRKKQGYIRDCLWDIRGKITIDYESEGSRI
jgi:hypothetical protein